MRFCRGLVYHMFGAICAGKAYVSERDFLRPGGSLQVVNPCEGRVCDHHDDGDYTHGGKDLKELELQAKVGSNAWSIFSHRVTAFVTTGGKHSSPELSVIVLVKFFISYISIMHLFQFIFLFLVGFFFLFYLLLLFAY